MASERTAGSILRGESDFGSPGIINDGIKRAIRCVCTVENAGSSNGTGLLIAQDLVLTNHHVVDRLLQPGAALDEAGCRFDYIDLPGGGTSEGVTVGIAEVGIAQSEPSPGDRLDGPDVFDPDKLDYAIIRLRRRMDMDGMPGNPRGWFPLPLRSPTIEAGLPILILQHPEGTGYAAPLQPLRQGDGEIVGVLADRRRFVHDATTRRGSSGSPCFSVAGEFDIVALHNARRRPGADAQGPERQAVAISWIVAHIQRTFREQGRNASFIGAKPPEPVVRPKVNRDDLVTRSYDAACYLMDRSTEESFLAMSFPEAGIEAPRPLVCMFVGQEGDLPEEFFERLKYAVFGEGETGRPRFWLKALEAGLPPPSGGVCVGAWPDRPASPMARKAQLERVIANFDPTRQRAIVLHRRIELTWSIEPERELLQYFADRLAQKFPDRPTLRAVVILAAPDQADGAALAAAFAAMWGEGSSPPGIGFCERMASVTRDDLLEWRDCLDRVWGGSDTFKKAFGQLPGRSARPLKETSEALAESLRAYIGEWLDRAPDGRRTA